MRIEMPMDAAANDIRFEHCVPYLASLKGVDGPIMTIMRFDETVAYFERDHSISHSSVSYFESKYNILRKYRPGESLTISM